VPCDRFAVAENSACRRLKDERRDHRRSFAVGPGTKGAFTGDVEKRTGLVRRYISRVENWHAVPAMETLEKYARALEVPLYQLFYDGTEPPKPPNPQRRKR